MERSEKWSTTRITFDNNNVFSKYDMTGVSSYIILFADNAKKMKSRIHKCKH